MGREDVSVHGVRVMFTSVTPSNRPKFMYLCSVLYVLYYINRLFSGGFAVCDCSHVLVRCVLGERHWCPSDGNVHGWVRQLDTSPSTCHWSVEVYIPLVPHQGATAVFGYGSFWEHTVVKGVVCVWFITTWVNLVWVKLRDYEVSRVNMYLLGTLSQTVTTTQHTFLKYISLGPQVPTSIYLCIYMYVCMYVCICMYVYTYVYTHTHTHTHTHIY